MKVINEEGRAFGLLSKEDQKAIREAKTKKMAYYYISGSEWGNLRGAYPIDDDDIVKAEILETKNKPLTQKEFMSLGVLYVEDLNSEYTRAYKVVPNGFYCENYITFQDCAENEVVGINYRGEEVKLYKETQE